ncbi:biotin carboxyl carrier protein of acetyl-CoA carboxylase, chloroplastic [Malania oleifera]|uniref:biotin carboxyl carrier protein of acetyl-CoA carboxylase, chloroplastic n=1 Tax=Malania oleifera TaxID=397392 RepID=UPI0025AE5D1D|nr:biotin carboxyl carrier protein of acetyl-CoA carboxylase, chloroplastic [Malania oleifera]
MSFSSMASSLATAAYASATASLTKPSPFGLQGHHHDSFSRLSFPLSPKPKLRFGSKGLRSSRSHSTLLRAELNEVAVDGSSSSAADPAKSEVSQLQAKDGKPSNVPIPAASASEESIAEFFTQVAGLVKLVDSKDIVELQMKQLDCELLIRKKEALPQPLSPAPGFMHAPQPAELPPAFQMAPAAAARASSAQASSAPTSVASSTPPVKSVKSSLPPLKCPMAGTFYRSPAPGEPPFVKVGDKVQKGQVMCIVEAMKLMNEIEADKSGTVVEILAEDGKSVSIDTPLFVIQP